MARYDSALEGVHPFWGTLFREEKGLADAMVSALGAVEALSGSDVTPPPHLVFEAFRYVDPLDVRVVIVGQDPYHTMLPGDVPVAQGLCFSCNSLPGQPRKAQPSLQNISRAVAKDCRLEEGGVALYDLRFWAAQGVFLLNAALTTEKGKAGAHSDIWADFTARLIRAICAQARHRIIFMLWGTKAKKLAKHADGHVVLTDAHPSPLAQNSLPPERKFTNCGHFHAANERLRIMGLREIQWAERAEGIVVATDGSCDKNGSPDARGGYGVTFGFGPLMGLKIKGPVAQTTYRFRNLNNPLLGIEPVPLAPGQPKLPVTNNRAEYLAFCYMLVAVCRAAPSAPVHVVVDCNLLKQTYEKWLPARKKKGTVSGLKNLDLVFIGDVLLQQVRARCPLTIHHINSHQKCPKSDPPLTPEESWALMQWLLNDEADVLAGEGQSEAGLVISPPFWFPHR
jgi:uracil-DNA glycosylase